MYIKELFYSFQGEGPFVGYPQLFIRFYGCNIHCSYCDEPDFEKDKRAVSMDWVKEQIAPYLDQPVHSVSITGGEPLLHVAAIKKLKDMIPFPFYLETNGTLPDRLDEVVDLFDYFSVDYKPGHEDAFREFMGRLAGRDGVFVKYILMKDFNENDMHFLGDVLAEYPTVPLVLQPVTPFAHVNEKVPPEQIFRAYELVKAKLDDVRVIPQTHKFIGVL